MPSRKFYPSLWLLLAATLVFTSGLAAPPFPVRGVEDYAPVHKNTLWYRQPATLASCANPWMEYALPIGNGQFGAMVFGGISRETVQFNDKTLWSGGSTTPTRGAYQNFGQVYIEDTGGVFGADSARAVRDYVRSLDLETGTVSVCYKSPDGSVAYKREYVTSHPDGVVVVRLSASRAGQVSVRVTLADGPSGGPVVYAGGEAVFGGKLLTVSYSACLRVVPMGGVMVSDTSGISVRGADEVLLVLAGGTDYSPTAPGYVSGTAGLSSRVAACAGRAAAKGWRALYAAHLSDYRALFGRASLDFTLSRNVLPTDELVDLYNSAPADSAVPDRLMLEQLYFAYGRYLLISSSRGVDLPANLQGIWNDRSNPPWESDIHSNINVQMNYWPAEVTNLSELHRLFLRYLYNMSQVQPQWRAYAEASGQTCGWTCFTQNNIFGQSNWGENYVVANAWYAHHCWLHYRYTLDRDFLRTTGLPVMVDACRFWMERLVPDRVLADGTLVCPDEYSPEQDNPSVVRQDATAHSQQLVCDLFGNTLAAVGELGLSAAGVDSAFVRELKLKYARLDRGLHTETYTGAWGDSLNGVRTGDTLLREWKYSGYEQGEPSHRHLSHLMCLYPLGQVGHTDSLFPAVVNSLRLRGDKSTGWSMGWKINLWARALDGDHAHRILSTALKHSTSYGVDQYAGGIYYNLFGSHAPFQIDGNFGVCAGVAEMLLQSYTDTLHLLPALPRAWAAGRMEGLKAVGGFTVDQTWEAGRLLVATVSSVAGRPCAVRYPGIARASLSTADGTPVDFDVVNGDLVVFPTRPGGAYTFVFAVPE